MARHIEMLKDVREYYQKQKKPEKSVSLTRKGVSSTGNRSFSLGEQNVNIQSKLCKNRYV